MESVATSYRTFDCALESYSEIDHCEVFLILGIQPGHRNFGAEREAALVIGAAETDQNADFPGFRLELLTRDLDGINLAVEDLFDVQRSMQGGIPSLPRAPGLRHHPEAACKAIRVREWGSSVCRVYEFFDGNPRNAFAQLEVVTHFDSPYFLGIARQSNPEKFGGNKILTMYQ